MNLNFVPIRDYQIQVELFANFNIITKCVIILNVIKFMLEILGNLFAIEQLERFARTKSVFVTVSCFCKNKKHNK